MSYKLKPSEPNGDAEESGYVCHSNLVVAGFSFFFPIYGVIKAIKSPYNRNTALIWALIGFVLAMVCSSMAPEGSEIGIGAGKHAFLAYEPLSPLDWLVNLLAGGLLCLRGGLFMLLNSFI